jgi:putative nucleotidyltransferase with HDIG domain
MSAARSPEDVRHRCPQGEGTLTRPLLLADVIKAVHSLPSLPALVLDLLASLEDAEVEVDVLARKIVLDQVLTARTLRVANSSFYGRQRKVATIHEAISVLGIHGLRNLALTATLMDRLAGGNDARFCFSTFWRHAIGTALCARALAARTGLNREQAYTAGLLHDIGRLVLATRFHAAYGAVSTYRKRQNCRVVDAESAVLGLDHAMVGEALARHWQLPDFVQQAVAHHHALPPFGTHPMALVVHVADALTHGLDLSGDDMEMVPSLAACTWGRLGLDADMLGAVLCEVEAQFEAACSVLGS